MIKLPLYRRDERVYALVEGSGDYNECGICALRDVCYNHERLPTELFSSMCYEFMRQNNVRSWVLEKAFFVNVTEQLYKYEESK